MPEAKSPRLKAQGEKPKVIIVTTSHGENELNVMQCSKIHMKFRIRIRTIPDELDLLAHAPMVCADFWLSADWERTIRQRTERVHSP